MLDQSILDGSEVPQTPKKRKKKGDTQANLYYYLRRIEAAENHRDAGYRDLWIRCYKRYRNYVDQLVDKNGKPITDRSNISIPYTFTQVETILPRLVETLFAARPYVSFFGRTPEHEFSASNMETLVDWQMCERMDMMKLFTTGLKELSIYGTTVAHVCWKLKERNVIKKKLLPVNLDDESQEDPAEEATETPDQESIEPEPDMGGPQYEPQNGYTPQQQEQDPLYGTIDDTQDEVKDWQPVQTLEKEYDDPEVKFVDLGNFFVDPNAEDIDDSRYCGHRSYETKEYIDEMAAQGKWKIDWRQIPLLDKHNQARADRMSSVGLPTNDENPYGARANMLYECHHYWEDDKYVVLINRIYVACEMENPYWHKRKPYVKDVYCEVPHEFYGMGVVEMIEDLQDELNNERNMRIDFRSFLLRRMFKARRGANIKREQLVFRQGGIIDVDDMTDVEEFGVKDIPASTFTQEQTIKQDMQDTSGAHDVIMGTSNQGETATTTMSKDNNASMRFKLVISSIEKRLLVGVARLMAALNQQFMDNEKVMRVTGNDGWVQLSPEDIQGEFDLEAAGSSVEPQANKEAFKQRMVELFNIVANNPIMQQYPQYIINLLRKVFEAYDIKNTDNLLPTDQETKGAQQQQVVQQFIASLPPQLQQLLQQFMQGGQPQGAPMNPTGEPTPPAPSVGGGANTAAMQEQGMQMTGAGGG